MHEFWHSRYEPVREEEERGQKARGSDILEWEHFIASLDGPCPFFLRTLDLLLMSQDNSSRPISNFVQFFLYLVSRSKEEKHLVVLCLLNRLSEREPRHDTVLVLQVAVIC